MLRRERAQELESEEMDEVSVPVTSLFLTTSRSTRLNPNLFNDSANSAYCQTAITFRSPTSTVTQRNSQEGPVHIHIESIIPLQIPSMAGKTNMTKISVADRFGLVFLFVILFQYEQGWMRCCNGVTNKQPLLILV